ncbi:response regulator [bacterium]|nr:MAG: response regulator [bacterium]
MWVSFLVSFGGVAALASAAAAYLLARGRDAPRFWPVAFLLLSLRYLTGILSLNFYSSLPAGLLQTLGALALLFFALGNRRFQGVKPSPVFLALPAALVLWGIAANLLGLSPSASSLPVYLCAFIVSASGFLPSPKGGAGSSLVIRCDGLTAALSLLGLGQRFITGWDGALIFIVTGGYLCLGFLIFRAVGERAAAKLLSSAEASPSGVLLADFGMRVVFASGGFCRATGKEPDEILGAPAAGLFSGKDREKFSEWVSGGRGGALTLEKEGGKTLRLSVADSFYGYFFFLNVNGEGNTRKIREELEGDASLVIDPESGLVLSANREAQKLFGLGSEELLSRTFWSFARAGGSGELRESVAGFTEGTPPFRSVFSGKSGEFEGLVRAVWIKTASGEALRVVIGGVRQKGFFSEEIYAAGVAHDLGNILQTIVACCDEAQGQKDEEALYAAREAALRGGEIARRLSKPGNGAKGEKSAVSLSALLPAVAKIQKKALPGNVALELSLAESLPPVAADGCHLEQVIINLLLNARDALGDKEGGVIRVEAAKSGSGVSLRVFDNGPGVPPGERERIFEPFYTTKPSGKGSGLGLAVSRVLIERCGGTLSLLPSPSGTRFEIILPRLRDSIIVVDPDPVVRARVSDLALQSGLNALHFVDAESALGEFSKSGENVCGVVTELLLPGAGGRKVIEAVKELSPECRILVLSSCALEEARAGALALGANGFLEKPLPEAAILNWLSSLN